MRNLFRDNAIVARVLNFLLFQIAWFFSVFCIVKEMSFMGVGLIGILAILYMLFSNRPQKLILLYTAASLLGFIVDSLLINSGAIWI